jgi:hypothetical protein
VSRDLATAEVAGGAPLAPGRLRLARPARLAIHGSGPARANSQRRGLAEPFILRSRLGRKTSRAQAAAFHQAAVIRQVDKLDENSSFSPKKKHDFRNNAVNTPNAVVKGTTVSFAVNMLLKRNSSVEAK